MKRWLVEATVLGAKLKELIQPPYKGEKREKLNELKRNNEYQSKDETNAHFTYVSLNRV
jgi:hypothetical protein